MIGYDAGDIVLVRFPFTDLSSSKRRPAVVVSPIAYCQSYGDIVLLALTSQDQHDATLALSEWRLAGLPKSTWVKPLIGTIALSLVDRKLGQIQAVDHACVKAAFARLLKLDWH